MRLFICLIVTSLSAATAGHAQPATPFPNRDDTRAAVETLRALQASTQVHGEKIRRVLLQVGAGSSLTGIAVYVAGDQVHEFALRDSFYRPILAAVSDRLAMAGLIAFGAGDAIMIGAAAWYTFSPTPARAAEFEEQYLYSSEGFQRFLDLPEERQLQIAGKRLRVAVVALAARVLAEP